MAKSPTVSIYGIPNCDTMKKARAWLSANGIAHVFHNYKTDGVERHKVEQWVEGAGWETILNRAGTTFRGLPEADRHGLDATKAVRLMLAQPSLIKRPVLERGELLMVGFKADLYARAFGV